jgi:putative tryptophan/tyrosine transport system substrate-binding protein
MPFDRLRRRDFITLLGGAVAWPLTARAQQAAVPVIGLLSGASPGPMRDFVAEFHRGLNETGYVEGRNVAIEYCWAEDRYDRLPALADDLVRRRVDMIFVAGSTPGALAAKAATRTIPIAFVVGTDPVKVGLVASLARPGGNITGITVLNVELLAKCLELMHEMVPAATTIAVFVNPANPLQTETETRDVQVAARVLGVRVVVLHASSPSEIDSAFVSLLDERAGALVVSGENFFVTQRDHLVALAARHSIPAIYNIPLRDFTAAGGLMNYGPRLTDAYRQVALYSGRILKGEKPADLPVQQVTKIEMFINLKTAKALGLTVPLALLTRADEVIE